MSAIRPSRSKAPQGVKIATDYNDYVKPRVLPDIATMNHAHSTHFTDAPDPGIKQRAERLGAHPRRAGQPTTSRSAIVRVRNVPTNIRNYNERRHRAARQFDLHL